MYAFYPLLLNNLIKKTVCIFSMQRPGYPPFRKNSPSPHKLKMPFYMYASEIDSLFLLLILEVL
jgi:hypothetical protein